MSAMVYCSLVSGNVKEESSRDYRLESVIAQEWPALLVYRFEGNGVGSGVVRRHPVVGDDVDFEAVPPQAFDQVAGAVAASCQLPRVDLDEQHRGLVAAEQPRSAAQRLDLGALDVHLDDVNLVDALRAQVIV